MVLEGPAGIGKSALLDEARRRAAGTVTMLGARGGLLERDFGFGVVRQLLKTVTRDRELPDSARALVVPGPLSPHGVVSLVSERLGSQAEPAFVAACHTATGGNPLLVRELAGALEADGVRPVAARAEVVRAVGPRAVSRTVRRSPPTPRAAGWRSGSRAACG